MIEPLVRVSGELINQMQTNHFRRMGQGVCSLYADAAFSNLMGDCKRIGAICSNVGIAVLVRAHPELADHEHLYFENLQNSGDGTFNKLFEENRNHYFALLNALPETKQA
jgi:phosphate:Na+ symporter